ncbi:hypothetical protein, partial [Burkholderia stabilis]
HGRNDAAPAQPRRLIEAARARRSRGILHPPGAPCTTTMQRVSPKQRETAGTHARRGTAPRLRL